MVQFFTMLMGFPGAGKTQYGEDYARDNDATLISADEMRKMLYPDDEKFDRKNNPELFETITDTVINCLKCKENVVFDATNLKRKWRKEMLDKISSEVDCVKICLIITTPFSRCVEHIQENKAIPMYVLTNMYNTWEPPSKSEGWNDIRPVYLNEKDRDRFDFSTIIKLLSGYNAYEFDEEKNKEFSYDMAKHLTDVAERVTAENPDDNELICAAMFHDLGKPYTESIKYEIFHEYKHHENVASYDSFFISVPEGVNRPEVAFIINHYLDIDDLDTEEKVENWKKEYGEEMYERIKRLYICDILSTTSCMNEEQA